MVKNKLSSASIYLLILAIMATPEAEASRKKPLLVTVMGAAVIMLSSYSYYQSIFKHTAADSSEPELSKLSYQLQPQNSSNESDERVLIPSIHRSKDFILSDQPEQLASIICTPVIDVAEIQSYQDRIVSLCRQWFKEHKMVFPHQILGVPAHTLNHLLLPKLVYSVEDDTLDFKVSLVSFVNTKGEPDKRIILDRKAPWQKRLWLIPKIPVAKIRDHVEGINLNFRVMQHYPIELSSTPVGDKYSAEFLFSIPGISLLYSDKTAFYIVVIDTSDGFVWKINESWPDGKKSMYFWLSQRNMKHLPPH